MQRRPEHLRSAWRAAACNFRSLPIASDRIAVVARRRPTRARRLRVRRCARNAAWIPLARRGSRHVHGPTHDGPTASAA
jgi:hypothetical protein